MWLAVLFVVAVVGGLGLFMRCLLLVASDSLVFVSGYCRLTVALVV